MDNAASVQGCQRSQHAEADRHRLGDAERAPLQAFAQRLAFQQLHGNKQLAAVLANLVDLADVRVVDAGRGPRFAPEAPARRLVFGHRRHRFQGNGALQPLVSRSVNDTHSTFAEFARNLIVPDARKQAISSGIDGRV